MSNVNETVIDARITLGLEVVLDGESRIENHAGALAGFLGSTERFRTHCRSHNEIKRVRLLSVSGDGDELVLEEYSRPPDGAALDPDVRHFRIFEADAPSEEFIAAVVRSGSSSIECEFCKRMHYGSDMATDEGQEAWEAAQRAAELCPKGHVFHDASSVSWGILRGQQAVADCPCNVMRTFENTMRDLWLVTLDYYRAVAQADCDAANDRHGQVLRIHDEELRAGMDSP